MPMLTPHGDVVDGKDLIYEGIATDCLSLI